VSALIESDLVCDTSAWVTATCQSPVRLLSGPCVFAHTAPVYLDVVGQPLRTAEEARSALLEVLSLTRDWVEGQARCETDRQRRHLLAVLDEARDRLLAAGG
jgi:hypothetical protein